MTRMSLIPLPATILKGSFVSKTATLKDVASPLSARHGGGAAMATSPRLVLPEKREVVGVPISVTTYDEVIACVMIAALERRPMTVTALAVHGVVEAATDASLLEQIRAFDIVTPDGQPVRFALNALYNAGLGDRVYGPTLSLKLCKEAAKLGIGVYFYGSTRDTVERLAANMADRFPGLRVVGAEPSLFRPLKSEESLALAKRIVEQDAGIVFVGLGCPRQERFAADHRDLISAPQICVGAAFDFHAGTKRQAPDWMQRYALEWLFRLAQEPRRLSRRYLTTNTFFVWRFLLQYISHKFKVRF